MDIAKIDSTELNDDVVKNILKNSSPSEQAEFIKNRPELYGEGLGTKFLKNYMSILTGEGISQLLESGVNKDAKFAARIDDGKGQHVLSHKIGIYGLAARMNNLQAIVALVKNNIPVSADDAYEIYKFNSRAEINVAANVITNPLVSNSVNFPTMAGLGIIAATSYYSSIPDPRKNYNSNDWKCISNFLGSIVKNIEKSASTEEKQYINNLFKTVNSHKFHEGFIGKTFDKIMGKKYEFSDDILEYKPSADNFKTNSVADAKRNMANMREQENSNQNKTKLDI
jgi:hypothetical protein